MITLLIEIQGTLMQVKSPFETILYIFRCSVATHFALLGPESSILILLYHISSDILLGISTVEQINKQQLLLQISDKYKWSVEHTVLICQDGPVQLKKEKKNAV